MMHAGKKVPYVIIGKALPKRCMGDEESCVVVMHHLKCTLVSQGGQKASGPQFGLPWPGTLLSKVERSNGTWCSI